MRVLAVETSCDETAAAIIEPYKSGVKIIADEIASSSEMHEKYGGIVPEVAAREQIKSIIPTIESCLEKADLKLEDIDKLAVTTGPGLIGSLLIGVESIKALAFVLNKPVIEVNHIAGHVFAAWIQQGDEWEAPQLPAVALIVSGGHSEFIEIDEQFNLKWLGGTKDDAAGECFDKCARVMGLGYPGGRAIEIEAEKSQHGVDSDIDLPLPFWDDGLSLSFSGLKTAVIRAVEKGVSIPDLARSINGNIAKILAHKTEIALKQTKSKSLILGGGVAANKLLRSEIEKVAKENDVKLFAPPLRFCTDNAAMIGAAAIYGQEKKIEEIKANPSWELGL